MKRNVVTVGLALFALALSFNVSSCKGWKLDAERKANEQAGFGKLTNEELENERSQNEAAGLGRICNAEVEKERAENDAAGLGRYTNAEIDAMPLNPRKVPEGYVFVDGKTYEFEENHFESVLVGWDYQYKNVTERKVAAVAPFIIGKTEVTQKLYESIMGKNPSRYKGANKPVERVSWYNAVEFCNALSKKDGLTPCYSKNSAGKWTWDKNTDGWRLPTESEWRWAAIGGLKSKGYKYSGSNNADEVAWFVYNGSSGPGDVGTKLPNELGLYDMSGNVEEWCWRLVFCGGFYNDDIDAVENVFELAYITALEASTVSSYPDDCIVGFRIVRSAPVSIAPNKAMTAGANLKLRSSEATSSDVLTIMQAGTKVKILELGKSETIDGIVSSWVKVEVQADAKDRDGKPIEQGLAGWCYGGYLF